MRIKCITKGSSVDEWDLFKYLSINEWYHSLPNGSGRYLIIDDSGTNGYYPKDLFITDVEYREQKLKELDI